MPRDELRHYRVKVSPHATREFVQLSCFTARLSVYLTNKFLADYNAAIASLRRLPYRNPLLHSKVLEDGGYRKMVFGKWYLLIYRIDGDTVYVNHVLDGRQDHSWLLEQ
jgi:plasmid stabilization system protein ParE